MGGDGQAVLVLRLVIERSALGERDRPGAGIDDEQRIVVGVDRVAARYRAPGAVGLVVYSVGARSDLEGVRVLGDRVRIARLRAHRIVVGDVADIDGDGGGGGSAAV